jgi:thiamine biosynthesis lipoprotein
MPHILKGVRNVLGTFVTITLVHHNPDEAGKALNAAFNEIYRINDLMSIHNESSEVSILNRNGFYKGISSDTKYIIERAAHFSKLSEGIFDITILPILELWKESTRKGQAPEDAEINKLLELVNYRDIVVEDKDIRFRKAGMSINLAAVAKGYAVDKAVETLSLRNIRHVMVNAGGDIRVSGRKNGARPWRIAIRDPRNKRRLSTTVELYEQAIATSGNYQRAFSDVINPKTGRAAHRLLSSTVITEKTIDADVLATCMFVLGAEKGTELLRKLDGVKALLITKDGDTLEFP